MPTLPVPTFSPPKGRVIKQDLITQLLSAIFSGRFRGGDRLIEKDLAEEYQVSRTPIREALNQLAATGLIEMQPNRGAVVRAFGPNQLRDIYELRQLMESHATKLAHARLDPKTLDQIYEQTAKLASQRKRDTRWSNRAMQVDEDLHELLAKASGNDRLESEIIRYRKLIRVIRQAIANSKGYQVDALSDHMEILKALRDGTAEQAAQAMGKHIGKAADAALNTVFSLDQHAMRQKD